MTRAVHYEYRRPGKPARHYTEWLVLDRPDAKVLLLDDYDGEEVRVDGVTILGAGAPIVWFVFPERWYDVGRFHLSDGTCTGWYTNLCRPVEMTDDRWIGRDLFLDLWQPIEGDPSWLDEDEFEHAIRSGLLDAATERRVRNERKLIDLQVRQGAWPPPIARDIDVDQTRAALRASQ